LIKAYQPIALIGENAYQGGDDEDSDGTERDFHGSIVLYLSRRYGEIR
jgi:hypothetical protein